MGIFWAGFGSFLWIIGPFLSPWAPFAVFGPYRPFSCVFIERRPVASCGYASAGSPLRKIRGDTFFTVLYGSVFLFRGHLGFFCLPRLSSNRLSCCAHILVRLSHVCFVFRYFEWVHTVVGALGGGL